MVKADATGRETDRFICPECKRHIQVIDLSLPKRIAEMDLYIEMRHVDDDTHKLIFKMIK